MDRLLRLSSGLQNLSGVCIFIYRQLILLQFATICLLLTFLSDNVLFILQGGAQTDGPVVDTAEQVYISSLALLKMLKHGRAGVPMEVMGLMLGEFVDDYTVRVIDVFAMPQSGTVCFEFLNYILSQLIIFLNLGCQCRSSRSSIPSENVGHASANW